MLDFLRFQFPVTQHFTAAPSLCPMRNGKLLCRTMRREFITDEEWKEKIRQEGIEDLATVKRLYFQADGEIGLIQQDEPEA